MPSTLIRVLPRLALAVTLAGAACGESAEEAIRSERAAADLVVGSTAAEWGLLTVPRGGGTAELRPIVSPDSVAWTGSAELPVATGAWAVGEQAIVLLDESGTVVRYLPAEDRVDRLATLSDRARAAALTSSAVVFLDSAGRFAYEVGSGHERGYTLDPPAAWARTCHASSSRASR
ncbi:MAG: hypothetical protein ACODAA_05245, partial [Gemmatimonadota bacterium]